MGTALFLAFAMLGGIVYAAIGGAVYALVNEVFADEHHAMVCGVFWPIAPIMGAVYASLWVYATVAERVERRLVRARLPRVRARER